MRPVRQVRILQAARLRKNERVSLRAWTTATCYSGSAAELVYHLSCLYTLSSMLDKIEEKSQPQFQGDSADRGAIANHDGVPSSYSAAVEHVAGFIKLKENVLNVSQTVCSVSITSLCDIFTSELCKHGVESLSYLSTEETSGRKTRGLCAISQGVYHPTVV